MSGWLAVLGGENQFVAPFALEGLTDILAGLYGAENFLMDLIEKPDKVKRAMEHFKRIWIEAFDDINEIIAKNRNQGRIGWVGIWAPGTTFPIQNKIHHI